MRNILDNINDNEISELIINSEYEIYYCSNGINEIIGKALLAAAKRNKVNILCNISEENDYNGISKFPVIEQLLATDNVTLHDAKAKTISFISDIFSFNIIWFPVPRIFKDDTAGYNVIHIDKQLALKLITSFWQLEDNKLSYVKDEAVKETINEAEELNQLDNLAIMKIDEFDAPSPNKLQYIKQTLKDVPPVEPDLKRQIELINRTLQFIEIKFEGAKIKGTKLTLPKGSLPFKNAELIQNIDSRLRIFDDVENYESFKKISAIEISLNELREKYLYRSKSKDKNLMKLRQKDEFLKEIEKLQKELLTTANILVTDLKNGIANSRKALKAELLSFYKDNKPKDLPEHYNFDGNEAIIETYCDELVNAISYPHIMKMVTNIKISHNEFDIALEDYDNEVFLEELAGSDFLSQEEYAELFQSETAIKVKAVINEGK